ncbi:MAG: hypothetical protein QME07_04500 [bacterium]|nr:hypothetical protein [bacterium]
MKKISLKTGKPCRFYDITTKVEGLLIGLIVLVVLCVCNPAIAKSKPLTASFSTRILLVKIN